MLRCTQNHAPCCDLCGQVDGLTAKTEELEAALHATTEARNAAAAAVAAAEAEILSLQQSIADLEVGMHSPHAAAAHLRPNQLHTYACTYAMLFSVGNSSLGFGSPIQRVVRCLARGVISWWEILAADHS